MLISDSYSEMFAAHYVRYAKDIRIVVNLQKNSLDGLIYPPFIEVTYSSVSLTDKDTSVPVRS